MSAKLYERCPMCEDWGAVPGFQCPACRGVRFIETGLTTGQFELYHRKSREEYERGLIDAATRWAHWKDGVQYVGAVTLTCLDTLAARVNDDDLADYVAEVASRLETVLRKLGWEPKQGEAK